MTKRSLGDGADVVVLFGGACLASLGLKRAGLRTVSVELNPVAAHLGRIVMDDDAVILGDVRDFDYSNAKAIWASSPCQSRSSARTQGDAVGPFAEDLLDWSLSLPSPTLWVENVIPQGRLETWGTPYNAAQFIEDPYEIEVGFTKPHGQQRNRMIGGRYPEPHVYRPYAKVFDGLCPAITATEWKGCATDKRRASRYYGRKLSLEECAYHMGFDIPTKWFDIPDWFEAGVRHDLRVTRWRNELYRAIGNGVPVYMAQAFGDAYGRKVREERDAA